MAKPIDASNIDVVGQGINEMPNQTDVPKGGQVSSLTVQQNLAQGAPPAAGAEPMIEDQGFVDPAELGLSPADPEGFMDPAVLGLKDVEEYAGGSEPDFAINESPLDTLDRVKLKLGNTAGNLSYLKQKYEDAALDSDGNVKIKKNGLWYAADPDTDPWERTKAIVSKFADPTGILQSLVVDEKTRDELNKDVAELIPAAGGLALGAGGAALGTLAGPAGSLAGAAAGAGAGEWARTSLGRLVGTYEASPEEQLKDIGIESLLGLGGQTVGLGVKLSGQMLAKGLQNLVSKPTATKEMISEMVSGMSGEPKALIRRAMSQDYHADVRKDLLKTLSRVKPTEAPGIEGVNILARDQGNLVKSWATKSDEALDQAWKANTKNIVERTPDNFSFDGKQLANEVLGEIEGKLAKRNADGTFRSFTAQERAMFAGGDSSAPDLLSKEALESLDKMVESLNYYAGRGQITGKQAAVEAMQFRRKVADAIWKVTKPLKGSFPDAAALGENVSNMVKTRIGKQFTDAGVGGEFTTLNNQYAKYVNAVSDIKDAASSPEGIDSLIKKLVSQPGQNVNTVDQYRSLAGLVGVDNVDRLLNMQAAKSMLNWLPKKGVGEGMIASGLKRTAGLPMGASPRLLSRQIELGHKFKDFVAKSAKDGIPLADNPQALAAALRSVQEGYYQQDSQAAGLLESQGIDPRILQEE